ncbi:hypothetical protein JTE90_011136 [Oedothorax gibbosus]|uniref:Uncharacterized protein n=1 Tax=Oedothorax gibbosus TaxID=931172 RepID=A0AAV6TVT4_9ARAC|nr:hypothetical protein JTE90_011136 [Oedothorax gibbosus]
MSQIALCVTRSANVETISRDETTVSGDETTASGGETTAGGDETTAGGDETTAGGDETTAGGDETTAGGDETTAGGDETTAGGDETTARFGASHTGRTNGDVGISDGAAEASYGAGKNSSINGSFSETAAEELHLALEKKQSDNKEKQASVDEKQAGVDEKHSSVDEKPANVDEKPASVDEKPASVDEKPASVDEKPASVDEKPATRKLGEKPASVDEKPASVDEKPASVDEKPASVDEKPASVGEKPASVDEKPASVDEKPASFDEKPASVTRSPQVLTRSPQVLTRSPQVWTRSPQVLDEKPASVDEKPASVDEKPATRKCGREARKCDEKPASVTRSRKCGREARKCDEKPASVTRSPQVLTRSPQVLTRSPQVWTRSRKCDESRSGREARKCGREARKCGREARKCGREARKCGREARKCGREAASVDEKNEVLTKERVDEKNVSVDEKNVSVDEKNVSVDEKNVSVDEKNVSVDEKKVSVDEKNISVDEKDISVDEKNISVDEKNTSVDEKNISVEASVDETTASGDEATASGYETTASGDESAAIGDESAASGDETTASHDETTASGDETTASGDETTASVDETTAKPKEPDAIAPISCEDSKIPLLPEPDAQPFKYFPWPPFFFDNQPSPLDFPTFGLPPFKLPLFGRLYFKPPFFIPPRFDPGLPHFGPQFYGTPHFGPQFYGTRHFRPQFYGQPHFRPQFYGQPHFRPQFYGQPHFRPRCYGQPRFGPQFYGPLQFGAPFHSPPQFGPPCFKPPHFVPPLFGFQHLGHPYYGSPNFVPTPFQLVSIQFPDFGFVPNFLLPFQVEPFEYFGSVPMEGIETEYFKVNPFGIPEVPFLPGPSVVKQLGAPSLGPGFLTGFRPNQHHLFSSERVQLRNISKEELKLNKEHRSFVNGGSSKRPEVLGTNEGRELLYRAPDIPDEYLNKGSTIGLQFRIIELPCEKTIDIPRIFRTTIRKCMYNVKKDDVDECLPGLYDFLILLKSGIKPKKIIIKDPKKAEVCLGRVFSVCNIPAAIVLNEIFHDYLHPGIEIIRAFLPKMSKYAVIDEQTKGIFVQCLKRATKQKLDVCVEGYHDRIYEILGGRKEQGYIEISPLKEVCLAQVLSVCSLRTRLELDAFILGYDEVLLDILDPPRIEKQSYSNFIREGDMRNIKQCLEILEKKTLDACQPHLYNTLVDLISGQYIEMGVLPYSSDTADCLGQSFNGCSVYSRIVIADTIKFATDATVEIPLQDKVLNVEPVTAFEKEIISPCLQQLDPLIVDSCLPGMMYVLTAVFNSVPPNLEKLPLKISTQKCLQPSFRNCSANERLIITELIYRQTNTFVNLMFAFDENITVDGAFLDIVDACINHVTSPVIDTCIDGLNTALDLMKKGELPPTGFVFELAPGADPNCPKKIFNNCSKYERILIDSFMRTLPRQIVDTMLSDIVHPSSRDAGFHTYTDMDRDLLTTCMSTVDSVYLESCVPGLYETLTSLSLPLRAIALRPIEGKCLEVAFAHCTYKSRLLTKKMLYDFAKIHLNLRLDTAPQGSTGSMGPPTSVIKQCISSINPTEAEKCVPGFLHTMHKIFVQKLNDVTINVISTEKIPTATCLIDLYQNCDSSTQIFLLEKIERITHIGFNFGIGNMSGLFIDNDPQFSIAKWSLEPESFVVKLSDAQRSHLESEIRKYGNDYWGIATDFMQPSHNFAKRKDKIDVVSCNKQPDKNKKRNT